MNENFQNYKWYLLSSQDVLGILNTASNGLSTAEVNKRQKESGLNILRRQGGDSAFKIFIRQFLNPILFILIGATILSFALGKVVDGIVVFQNKRLTAEILALKPDVYCKAGDYTLEKLDPDERRALEQVGAEIRFLPFLPGFSTTNLIAKIKAAGEV